ncbi:zf-CCHC domain-containing protein/RVP_2 domain-containing protein [Gossypium australe]|uniref:Zf-CCHC domain-containing protein/RVP_2 domain-containing protein n=1 Tax=Gossypium australe TaxID=47621 RepID=A0A5B6WST9_9ROSI|nr:zf-CCHC domain-containing protein/RVP_2 domain-containing protein [Gossypium australe]
MRSKAQAPARACAIRDREEATSPNVITASKSLPIEFTEFVVRVSNPLGKHVLVDRVRKNCPLMIRGHCFSVDLMLLPFDEFDVILGMDWLKLHDAVVNCKSKIIELKCENGEILGIDSDESVKVNFGSEKSDFWDTLFREMVFGFIRVRFQQLLIGNRREMYLKLEAFWA